MELNSICDDILQLLKMTLVKATLGAEPAVFYQKVASRAIVSRPIVSSAIVSVGAEPAVFYQKVLVEP